MRRIYIIYSPYIYVPKYKSIKYNDMKYIYVGKIKKLQINVVFICFIFKNYSTTFLAKIPLFCFGASLTVWIGVPVFLIA